MWNSPASVLDVFRDEIDSLGGKLFDHVADDFRLYARALLPGIDEVARGDRVRPGVALRFGETDLEVRPFVLRTVCRNGAVVGHSAEGARIYGAFSTDDLKSAIRSAASPEAFRDFVGAMRSSRNVVFDMAHMLMRVSRRQRPEMLLDLLERYRRENGRSLFDAGNAWTSLARDTSDPEQRWRFEVMGAAVFARLLRPVPERSARQPV